MLGDFGDVVVLPHQQHGAALAPKLFGHACRVGHVVVAIDAEVVLHRVGRDSLKHAGGAGLPAASTDEGHVGVVGRNGQQPVEHGRQGQGTIEAGAGKIVAVRGFFAVPNDDDPQHGRLWHCPDGWDQRTESE